MATKNKAGASGEAAAFPIVTGFSVSAAGPNSVRLIFQSRFGDSIAKLTADGAVHLAAYLESVIDPVFQLQGNTNQRVGVRPEMAAQMARRLRDAQHEQAAAMPSLFGGYRDANGADPVANLRTNAAARMRACGAFPRQVEVAT